MCELPIYLSIIHPQITKQSSTYTFKH